MSSYIGLYSCALLFFFFATDFAAKLKRNENSDASDVDDLKKSLKEKIIAALDALMPFDYEARPPPTECEKRVWECIQMQKKAHKVASRPNAQVQVTLLPSSVSPIPAPVWTK